MRILNLYAGIGGNRKKWPDGVLVDAVERDEKIAAIYQEQFPDDVVYTSDAHDFLLKDFDNYDFIWSSPPCQSHSRMIRGGRNRKPRYPDMKLYEEILFLKHNFPGKWVVENVVPYYEPLMTYQKIGRHVFWCNFEKELYFKSLGFEPPSFSGMMKNATVADSEKMKEWLGIHYEGNLYYEGNHCPSQVLRNAVHPDLGRLVFDAAFRETGQIELQV